MQYNYHCNRVVILTLRTCTILVIFSCFQNTTYAIASNKKKNQTIYLYNCQYLLYIIIWGIVFPEYFNQKLFLFVDLYLSPDKLASFYVWVGRVGHGNSTPLNSINKSIIFMSLSAFILLVVNPISPKRYNRNIAHILWDILTDWR